MAPVGFIDKRNSGVSTLDFATDIYRLTVKKQSIHPCELIATVRSNPSLQKKRDTKGRIWNFPGMCGSGAAL